jgi:hypothetical protein
MECALCSEKEADRGSANVAGVAEDLVWMDACSMEDITG